MKKRSWAIALLGAAIFIGIGTYLIAGTVTKGVIGKQELALWYSADSAQTYTRSTSEGYTMTLNKLDWVGIDVFQVYGGGVNRTGAVIISAACDVGMTATRTLWLSPGTWSIIDDVDLTGYENLTIAVPRGVDLAISSGKKVSIPGTIEAGPYQIASGDGTLSYNRTGITRAFAQWWNATTVDTSSTNTALVTTEVTLASGSIPGGLMGTVGGIRVFAWGYTIGIAGTKSLKFHFNDSSINFIEPVNDKASGAEWMFEAVIWNISASIQSIYWKTYLGQKGGTIAYNHNGESFTEDTTAALTMKITGQCGNAADYISKELWQWERM